MRAAGDPVDHHGGAGGLAAVLEELVVDVVGDLEILGLVEEDVAHDHVPEVEPGLLERRLDVPHRLPDLLLERGGMAAVGELVALARDVERVAREDPGAVREAGRGGADGLPLGEVAVGDAGDLDPRVARHLRDAERRPRGRVPWKNSP